LAGTASGAVNAARNRAKASINALESLATNANSNARNISPIPTIRRSTLSVVRLAQIAALLFFLLCACFFSLVFACQKLSVGDVFMAEQSVDALIAENKLLKQRLASVGAIRANKDLLTNVGDSAAAASTTTACKFEPSAGDNQALCLP
jgi:hypothetical protein